MQVIIPSGGMGKRLKPLILSTPKAMVKIMDKPVIAYICDLLKAHNIKEATLTLDKSSSLADCIKDLDIKDISFKYIYEKEALGTAGALPNTYLWGEDILIIYGDLVTDFNLTDMIKFHKKHKPLVTLGAVGSNINTGILILNKRAISFFPNNCFFDFYEDFLPIIKEKNEKILTFYDNCYFYDINTPNDYKSCNRSILINRLNRSGIESLSTKNVIIEDNSHLEIGAAINPPVYIGRNVYIEAGAEIGAYSVIGENCKIYSNSHTEGSVIMANSLISDNSFLKDTIISENTKIKSGVKICEDTVIGNDCIIGKNNIIKPNVNIWPGRKTRDNETIFESLITEEPKEMSLFISDVIEGDFDIEINTAFLLRTGLAISNAFKAAKFLIAADKKSLSEMAKNALIAGVMEGGGEVQDASDELICVFKEGLSLMSCDFGIYITSEKTTLKITLYDSYGAKLSKSGQNKIDRLFSSGNFFSAGIKNIKPLTVSNNLFDCYLEKVSANFKKTDKKRILYYKEDSKKITDYLNRLKPVSSVTPIHLKDKSLKTGELCASFINNGEGIILYDENGKEKTFIELFLITLKLLKDKGIKKIVVPSGADINLSSLSEDFFVIEADESRYIKRLKTENLNEQYLLSFDKVYFTVRLTDYLSKNSLLLKDLNL